MDDEQLAAAASSTSSIQFRHVAAGEPCETKYSLEIMRVVHRTDDETYASWTLPWDVENERHFDTSMGGWQTSGG